MDNKVLAAIFGGIALLCVTVLGVAFIVTGGGEAPAPVVTSAQAPEESTPEPVETSNPLLDVLEETWNEQSYSDQQLLCSYYKVDPDGAFESFDKGAEGILPQELFDQFLSEECLTI